MSCFALELHYCHLLCSALLRSTTTMAAAAATARSLLRASASLLRAAPARSASSSATRTPLRRALAAPPRLLRSPVEASFCVESLLPLHSATAAARMTSMLAVPGRGLGWLTEAETDGV
ncbi:protein NUCLEAR FUSION DEFECTIVE 6, mitochondrial-like isoform X2 [Phragmites australis]|uniref:protein NUCLEAR FUSION DEFECTIVE 6, mitochondrial-like isoform X2 n=1 Tax=Phragmites australis TaxID=29695 RepID=UPI002D792954|nr:protein NUCLEAR FUSION DEFECTIVE 6, mitochondrial-like isoform X2 [Phragmites australis]